MSISEQHAILISCQACAITPKSNYALFSLCLACDYETNVTFVRIKSLKRGLLLLYYHFWPCHPFVVLTHHNTMHCANTCSCIGSVHPQSMKFCAITISVLLCYYWESDSKRKYQSCLQISPAFVETTLIVTMYSYSCYAQSKTWETEGEHYPP